MWDASQNGMSPETPHLHRTARLRVSYSKPSAPTILIPPMTYSPPDTRFSGSCTTQMAGSGTSSTGTPSTMTFMRPEGHSTTARTICSRTSGSSALGSIFHGVPSRMWQNLDREHLWSSSRTIPGPSDLVQRSSNVRRSAFSFPLNLLWDDPSQNGASQDLPHLHSA